MKKIIFEVILIRPDTKKVSLRVKAATHRKAFEQALIKVPNSSILSTKAVG